MIRPSLLGLWAAAAFAAAALVPDPALAQTGTVGIRLTEVPADLAEDPRAQVYIIDHVSPDSVISRNVEVVNNTVDSLTIRVYPGAAEIRGARFSPMRPEHINEIVRWTDIEPGAVTLPPGGSQTAKVTINVPSDAQDGERYGVIWAQPPAADAGGPQIVNRVGVRIYLSVGSEGAAEPQIDFDIHSLVASRSDDGRPTVRARVVNTGERALDLGGELSLSDGPAGLSAGPFAAESGTTLGPGDEGRMTVLLDPELPSGPWLARMVARSGTLEKSVEATIVFPDAAGGSSEPVAATEVPLHRNRGVLIPLALGLLLLALLLLFIFWWWRRRKDDEEDEAERQNGLHQVREKFLSRK